MYNLLVSGNPKAWTGKHYDYDLERVARGYTSPSIRSRFSAMDEDAIATLTRFPCVFAYEHGNNQPARIGWLTRVRHRNDTVRVEFEFESALPNLDRDVFQEHAFDLDIGTWEMNRTHWAIKDIDLFPALIETGVLSRRLINRQPKSSKIITLGLERPQTEVEARPTVFRVPTKSRDPKLVSVMMPFTREFDEVYEALQDACETLKLSCERADNVWESSEVIQDIFSLIYRSEYVICDFSGMNPNVFYEAGIAHTLGRTVIPISQNSDHVPFDLRHHRYVRYHNNKEGRGKLTAAVSKRLGTLRAAI